MRLESRQLQRKNRRKQYMKRSAILLASLIFVGIASFYIFIVSGWVSKTQELWVTTAMTTLSHKWLATAFIDQAVIDEIMKKNKVDDTGYTTNPDLAIESATVTPEKPSYEKQGYSELESGIYIKDVSGTSWKGKLLLVEDPSRVNLVQTRHQWKRGDLIKTLVPYYKARVGINAGGFADGPNFDSNGGTPSGLLIVDGKVINSSGKSRFSVIGINNDNVLVLGKMTKQEALNANLRSAVDFAPFLIVNGEPMMKGDEQGGWGIAPRTAIGQRQGKNGKPGEMLFLVIDGRQIGHSIGADLRVLQDQMIKEGAINAAMLDGGSSTVMYHADKGYLNRPSLGHERYINNCWIVK